MKTGHASRTEATLNHFVVERAKILDSQLAVHEGRMARAVSCGRIKNPVLLHVGGDQSNQAAHDFMRLQAAHATGI